jgi:hypothetical protein
MFKYAGILLLPVWFTACQHPVKNNVANVSKDALKFSDSNTYIASLAGTVPVIDGISDDSCWAKATWDTLDQRWLGAAYGPDDFSGRYKAVWGGNRLYFYLEIADDSILNIHEPLVQYWDDDCVEIFIDENASGGIHQYSHQAFAYHIAPNMDAVDIGPDQKPHTYNSHVKGKVIKVENRYCWELAVTIYPDTYSDDKTDNLPVELFSEKMLGFSMAYCDNDTSETRENFIGSVNTPGHFKNDGWIDASCFGKMVLTE